jgi:hypothetical protein
MIHASEVRARVPARRIAEHAESTKVAAQGGNTQTRGTSALRDLRVPRVMAGRATGNAVANNPQTQATPPLPTPRPPPQ